MLSLKYKLRWQLAGILLLLFAITGALLPDLPFWDLGNVMRFRHSDKILHFLTFAFLAGWFSGQQDKHRYWRILVGLVAFGALIELTQGMVSYRVSEWMDLYSDLAGILFGLGIAVLGLGGWSLRVERWLENLHE